MSDTIQGKGGLYQKKYFFKENENIVVTKEYPTCSQGVGVTQAELKQSTASDFSRATLEAKGN